MLIISVPGSKSISNRYLILKALCQTDTTIHNLADCDDTTYMLKALKLLASEQDHYHIYTGNAGTTTRFFTAYSTLLEKNITIEGDERMQERPIAPLTDALQDLGAKVTTTNGCPPVKISPSKLQGGSINLPGNISSQYLSALLMIAPFSSKPTTINITEELCSKPYVDITIKAMEQFGLNVTNHNYERFEIKPQSPTPPTEITVENDCSSASYPAALAMITNKPIMLTAIHKNSIQGDSQFINILEKMGAKTKEHQLGIAINPQPLKTLGKIDMNSIPDLVMTFAALAMITPGTTTLTNIANLRIKETDRLKALKKEIEKFSNHVETGEDYIKIEGLEKSEWLKINQKKSIFINTYNDHRIAMCFGIFTPLLQNLEIENKDCVSKSYTTFWQDLEKF